MKTVTTLLSILLGVMCLAQTVSDDLLLYYPYSGNSNDASGNGYDGIVNASLTEDRFGNPNEAFGFNGADEYIDFPNALELKPSLPVSFSFWIKYSSVESIERVLFNTSMEDDVSSGVVFNSQGSSGRYAVNFGDGSSFYGASSRRTYVSNSAIDTSEWHHIAVVVNGATDMKIYVDCIESGGTYSGSGGDLAYSDTPGSVGRHDAVTGGTSPFHFKGSLDEFRYWDRALTEIDVDSLCNNLILGTQGIALDIDKVYVYPNPAQEVVHIRSDSFSETAKMTLNDLYGHVIYEGKFQSELNIDALESGVYFLQLLGDTYKHRSLIRIVKN